jgi:VanZ family protein
LGTSLLVAARITLAALIFLLYYGSLYPGVMREGVTFASAWDNLLRSFELSASPRAIVDILLNVLVYIPPGLVFCMAFRWRWPWRIAGAVLMGFVVTVSVEVLQGFVATREQSLMDCIANTLGAGVGAAGGWLVGRKLVDRVASAGYRWMEHDTVLLLGVWLVAQSFPLFPSIGFYKLARQLETMVSGGILQMQTMVTASEWVVVALAVERLAGAAAVRWMLLLLTVLPMRLFIYLRQLTLSEIAGALLALCFWRLLLFRRPWRNWAGALVILAGVSLSQLMPLRFANQASSFNWQPFAASLATHRWELALITLTGKAFRYGAMVWMTRQCGAGYFASGLLAAILLFATEMAQRYLPGRTPEIADALLAVIMATLLWMAQRTAPDGKPRKLKRR